MVTPVRNPSVRPEPTVGQSQGVYDGAELLSPSVLGEGPRNGLLPATKSSFVVCLFIAG